MEKHVSSAEALKEEAAVFAKALRPKEDSATLVTLSGELGAGKTTFTQGLASALGVEEAVTSPTFVLEKVYALTDQLFKRLVHIDAYRLEGGQSLAPLGFQELMEDSATLVVLEWPEMVARELPEPTHTITLAVDGEGRSISYA